MIWATADSRPAAPPTPQVQRRGAAGPAEKTCSRAWWQRSAPPRGSRDGDVNYARGRRLGCCGRFRTHCPDTTILPASSGPGRDGMSQPTAGTGLVRARRSRAPPQTPQESRDHRPPCQSWRLEDRCSGATRRPGGSRQRCGPGRAFAKGCVAWTGSCWRGRSLAERWAPVRSRPLTWRLDATEQRVDERGPSGASPRPPTGRRPPRSAPAVLTRPSSGGVACAARPAPRRPPRAVLSCGLLPWPDGCGPSARCGLVARPGTGGAREKLSAARVRAGVGKAAGAARWC